jgi:hypothetical protein
MFNKNKIFQFIFPRLQWGFHYENISYPICLNEPVLINQARLIKTHFLLVCNLFNHQAIYCLKSAHGSYRYINTFIIFYVVISVLDKYKYHIIMAMILLMYKCIMSFLHDTTLLINLSPL